MFEKWFRRRKEVVNQPLKLEKTPETDLVESVIEPEEDVKITVSKENGFFKVEISDYVSIPNWMKQMENFKDLDELISNNISWNSDKQKREKGIYYIFVVDNRVYNVLINEYVLKIDERTLIDFDAESQKDNVTIERIIRYLKDRNKYGYTCFKHDKVGSSFSPKWYPNDDDPILAVFGLSLEEAYSEIESVISNLEGIESVADIVDLDLLKESILGEIKKKMNENDKKI